jgi:hypothetical protein
MAIKSDITGADLWFTGEDKILEFEVLSADGTTAEDVSSWTLQWVVRKTVDSPNTLILKEALTGLAVVGVYNSIKSVNTQRVRITITAEDTEKLAAAAYPHALKRTDDNGETILAYGTLTLLKAAAH